MLVFFIEKKIKKILENFIRYLKYGICGKNLATISFERAWKELSFPHVKFVLMILMDFICLVQLIILTKINNSI